jgi:hypothetical protein
MGRVKFAWSRGWGCSWNWGWGYWGMVDSTNPFVYVFADREGIEQALGNRVR